VADYIRAQGYGHDQGRAINCPALVLPRLGRRGFYVE